MTDKEQATRNKILDCIAGERSAYIKDDGTWNIAKIARDTKSCKKVVKKHLQDIDEKEQKSNSLF